MNEQSPKHHDWVSETIADIDAALDMPYTPLDEALNEAVAKGRMTQQEADECYAAYERTFQAGQELE